MSHKGVSKKRILWQKIISFAKMCIRDREILKDNPWTSANQLNYATTTHVDMVEFVYKSKKLPCLYFVFSRRQCEQKADELSKCFNFLTPTPVSYTHLLKWCFPRTRT